MKKIILLLFCCMFFFGSCITNRQIYYPNNKTGNMHLPSKPGACYAKINYPTTYQTLKEEILIYTGNDTNQQGVESQKVIITPASTKWEKRKASGCRSSNPDNCMVWCLVEIPEESVLQHIVTDTTLINDYSKEIIEQEQVQRFSRVAWSEVLCANKVTKQLAIVLTNRLKAEGYLHTTTDRINDDVKKALVTYQTDNKIGVGGLTLETLEHLEINW